MKSLRPKGGKKGERILGRQNGSKLYGTIGQLPYIRQQKKGSNTIGVSHHAFVGLRKRGGNVFGLHYDSKASTDLEKDEVYSFASSSDTGALSIKSIHHRNNVQKIESWKKLIDDPENIPNNWMINVLSRPSTKQLKKLSDFAGVNFLTSVDKMFLKNINISRVPPDQLCALLSIVRGKISINNIKGDVSKMLTYLKCQELNITNQCLSSDETQRSIANWLCSYGKSLCIRFV